MAPGTLCESFLELQKKHDLLSWTGPRIRGYPGTVLQIYGAAILVIGSYYGASLLNKSDTEADAPLPDTLEDEGIKAVERIR